jgi:opacity protein-like surface antigen
LGGHKASPLLGVGAEYKVNRNVALTLNLDGYGKVSENVKASAATLGMRYSF